jgi:hypothetical protein
MNGQSEALLRAMEALDLVCRNSPISAPQDRSTISAVDPFAWAEDFHRWALSRCAYRDRCFGGIGVLHRDFCEWAASHESVPCTRRTFEQLLSQSGFYFAEGMVSGLILRVDFEGAA